MFKIFKYYDIIEMEEKFAKKFASLNSSQKICILPPVFRKDGFKMFLAYPVISDPKYKDNHAGVTRPIGFILRNRKTGEFIQVSCCDKYDFAPERLDFEIEYYDLEAHPNYWPNRTNENEEKYRTILEKLYKANKSISVWGSINEKTYSNYLEEVKDFFPSKFWYFYEKLETAPIIKVDEELKYKREEAKHLHAERVKELNSKIAVEHAFAHEKLIKDVTDKIIDYIKKEVLPLLNIKPDVTKVLFYNELGKIFRDLKTNQDCRNCYDTTLTKIAREQNTNKFIEKIKIDIIKKFSRSCATHLTSLTSINNCCKTILIFLQTMLLEEVNNEVTEQSKHTITKCIDTLNILLPQVSNNQMREEFSDLAELICRDYYEVVNEEELSNLYIGFSYSNKPNNYVSIL